MELVIVAVFGVSVCALALCVALIGVLRFAGHMADRLVALHSVPAADALARLRSVGKNPPPSAPDAPGPAPVPDLGPSGMWDPKYGKDFDQTGN
jgi:hypothetical protein